MIVIGLAVLCASAFGAISASSASAGGWFYTCVEHAPTQQGKDKYEDKDCKTPDNISGEYGHVSYSEWTTWKIDPMTNTVITGKLFGASVEIQATGVECVECKTENKEVGGVKEATGTGKLELTGVTAVGLPACTVNSGKITTQNLKFTTTSETGLTLEPETGTLFAEFNITGASCTVAGSNIKITGKAFASASGAQFTINVTKASEELKLEGEKATLKALWTLTAGKPFSGEHHPISLTFT
jgi:hypothetical protein